MNEKYKTGNSSIEKIFDDSIEQFFKRFKISAILRKINASKSRGVSTCILFVFLMKLVFTKKNLYRTYESAREEILFEKDAVYRLLCNPTIRW
jgi:hypothetical protein